MKKKTVIAKKYYIAFDDYHNDGGDKAVEVSQAEYDALPDDEGDFWCEKYADEIFDRPEIDMKLSDFQAIEYRIPIV